MNKFFVLAIVGIIFQASVSYAYPECDTNDPDDLTFYPMPECNKFYQCVGGTTHVFTCQEGLVFNYQEQVCDYPENVDCDNQIAPTEGPVGTDGPSTNHPDCSSEEDLTLYPMPDCNQFYQCVNGDKYVQTCQEGLVFNFELQVCDYPENVDCDNQQPPTEGPGTDEPSTEDPEVPKPTCDGDEDLTLYPGTACDKYYQCVDGEAEERTCPDGLHFNFEAQVCDHPENVDCA